MYTVSSGAAYIRGIKMHDNDKCKSGCGHIDGIVCDVKNCQYHVDGCHCAAGKISVGPSSAITSADTVCATFKPKAE